MPEKPKVTPMNERYWDLVEQLDSMGVEVSEWEAKFLESILYKGNGYLSDKQKAVVEDMAKRYLD